MWNQPGMKKQLKLINKYNAYLRNLQNWNDHFYT